MALHLEEGDLLLGRYRIGPVLGQGGMAVVVAAVNEETDHRVAIKYLAGELADDPQVKLRFEREARASAKLKSRHVPIVFDTGKVDDAFFLVMEVLEGCDLEKALDDRKARREAAAASTGPFPFSEAVDIVLMACDAMAEAHALGIVHRDIKPANLFLADAPGGGPVVKVLDFGLSKTLGPNTMSVGLTSTADVFGSPLYMSPEQLVSSGNVDSRTDIWALGVVLYELVTGTTPFHASSMVEIWSAIMVQPATRPSTHRTDLPRELDDAIMKCLEKDPSARFRTIADLAGALAPFGSTLTRVCVERARVHQPDGFEAPASLQFPISRRQDHAPAAATAPAPLAQTTHDEAPSEPPFEPKKPTNTSILPPYLRKSGGKHKALFALVAIALLVASYLLFLR